ncbi:multiple organellar RNA editing factor 8, chloroplastic/mitochondrial [Tanacetum coccineum]
MLGRPPIVRKKDKNKLRKHVARYTRVMTCQNCYQTGHTKATCNNPPGNKPTRELKNQGRLLVKDRVNVRVLSSRKGGRGGSGPSNIGNRGGSGPSNTSDGSTTSNTNNGLGTSNTSGGSCPSNKGGGSRTRNIGGGPRPSNRGGGSGPSNTSYRGKGKYVLNEVLMEYENVDVEVDMDSVTNTFKLVDVQVMNENVVDANTPVVDAEPHVVAQLVKTRIFGRLFANNWNRKPLRSPKGEGTTPEKAISV